MQKLYIELASTIQAHANCCKQDTEQSREWKLRHLLRIKKLVREHMPRGSGVDNGTSFNFDKSSGERLVFETSFHHMNHYGMYDGWTEHTVVVTPSLVFGFNLRITGRNRNDIKDYLDQLFREALMNNVKLS